MLQHFINNAEKEPICLHGEHVKPNERCILKQNVMERIDRKIIQPSHQYSLDPHVD